MNGIERMNIDQHRFGRFRLVLSVFICGSTLCFIQPAFAQRQGLDALTDDALMNELALRGLDSLLERAFEVNNVPEAQRQARRSLIAMSRLADPNARLTSRGSSC